VRRKLSRIVNDQLARFELQVIRKPNRNFDSIINEVFTSIDLEPKIIVDVGAHKGESINRFSKCYPFSRIFSFEPNPLLYREILENIQSTNTRVFNYALSNVEQELQFHIHLNSTGSSSVLPINLESNFAKRRNLVDEKDLETINIRSTTLDCLQNEGLFERINILKIDTQGSELDVLMGASNLLNDQKIDLIEYEVMTHDGYGLRNQWSMSISFLLEKGYVFLALSNDGRFYNLGSWDILQNPELQFDVIFVKKSILKEIQRRG
jgi:FkbM family methyltransferase